jgi:hypothetical protein
MGGPEPLPEMQQPNMPLDDGLVNHANDQGRQLALMKSGFAETLRAGWTRLVEFWKTQRPHEVAEGLLHRWGALVVVLFALGYYGQYYRSGLNLGGEGGTVALYAMRLMEGYRPLQDTFLGYNVLWFYPVAWLFELTGPNYIALRLYFFAICTITGVLAFLVVRRVTGRGWFAVLAALGPVLIPGMLFRNYMAFLAVLNMLTLLQAYVVEQPRPVIRWVWTAAAGLSLGLTYLIRIDLGAFFTLITLGLLVLYPLGFRSGFWKRCGVAAGSLILTVAMVTATHAPFVWDAKKRGYDDPFLAQYTGWMSLVAYLAKLELAKQAPPAPPPVEAAAAEATPGAESAPVATAESSTPPAAPVEKSSNDIESTEYLQKIPMAALFKDRPMDEKIFLLLTYLPIPVAGVLVGISGLVFLGALVRRDTALRAEALTVLIATGAALTLFPQYFFFRPDPPHLSEFMAPFLIAMACGAWIFVRWSRFLTRWGTGLVLLLIGVNIALYFYQIFPKESAGTIAAKRKRTHELKAENGVHVWLKRQECEELRTLCEVIKTRTRPGDYLVTYPYSPTVNFMTDRPSFEYNLYVDNAHNVASFHEETLREFEKYRPAAVVIDNRAVNKTEASRFKNWAAETYRWLQENYHYAGTYRRQEVYLRPDLAPH